MTASGLAVAALLAAADPPPANAPQGRPPEVAPQPPPAPTPVPTPAPPPLPGEDEDVVRHLEILEKLDLLRRLELFDPGEEPPKPESPGPAPR